VIHPNRKRADRVHFPLSDFWLLNSNFRLRLFSNLLAALDAPGASDHAVPNIPQS
jgi:hypothetical protein